MRTKRNRWNPNRRSFLKLGAAGIVTGAVAPTLWLPRTSRATPAFGQVKHLIVINTDGGMRSTCMFNSNVSEQWNPPAISGVQPGAAGTEWGVGGVFAAAAHDGGLLGPIPTIPEISNQICVLGTVDHTPGEERGDGNHDSAQLRIATGEPAGTVGLLTRIYRGHALYQGNGVEENLPPVVIGAARNFGVGTGEWGPFRPVTVNDHRDFRSGNDDESTQAPKWAIDMERATDDWFAAMRAERHRDLVNGLIDTKRQALNFKPIFTNPVLDVENSPTEAMHGMTNAELVAALGSEDLSMDAALALRFLGFGAPAVALGHSGWDFHSDELSEFPAHAAEFDRMLCGLHFALRRLAHPDGGTYYDHTLVAVVSEFGRDNVDLTGFNSGEGSDHNGGPGCRYQALPFFGGVVGQGGRFFGATDAVTMEPKNGEPVFSTKSMLAMFLDVLGIDPTDHYPDAPLEAIF